MARLKALDLTTRAEQGAPMVIRDYTQAPGKDGVTPPVLGADGAPATLTIKGVDAPSAKALDHAARVKRENAEAAKAALLAAGATAPEQTIDDITERDAEQLARIVAMTIGWSGIEGDDGTPAPFSSAAVETLYVSNPQVMQDALLFHYRRADFFAQSLPPSAPSAITSSV